MKKKIAHNVLQLNADFVLHKICDLGAVSFSCLAWDLETFKNKIYDKRRSTNRIERGRN